MGDFALTHYTPVFVHRMLRHFRWLKATYRWLLRRVSPQWLLVADPGETPLVAAARELGVQVAELQHGLLDRVHAGYAWSDYATQYRAHMPVPDRLFLFGEHWRRELALSSFWGDALRVVGSPRIERYRAMRQKNRGDSSRLAVVTTQGIETPRMIAFVRELALRARAAMPLRVIVKLHPVYDQSAQPYRDGLADVAEVGVLMASEGPATFALLTEADLHLSISSSVHYDALALGVRTGVLPFATADLAQSLVDAGHATVVRSAQDALDLLTSSVPEPAIGEYYFASGALQAITRELKQAP
jgi:hypothetical protein